MNGTTILYGSGADTIVINNCQTREFSQEAVYDPSNTDLSHFKYKVVIDGCCHTQGTATVANITGPFVAPVRDPALPNIATLSPDGAAGQWQFIHAALMTPRKRFVMRIGDTVNSSGVSVPGKPLLSVNPQSSAPESGFLVEVNNGPKPIECKISSIVGNHMLRIRWTVEIHARECVSQSPSSILSNRWSMTDEIDDIPLTTRTMQGTLVIVAGSANPHSLRGAVLPPLAVGFRRTRISFGSSADGTKLEYSITDRELCFAPPYPATSWSMRHTETFETLMKSTGTCTVVMVGPRNASKASMLTNAVNIANWRLKGSLQNATASRTLSVVVTDTCSEHENRIEATIVIERYMEIGGAALADLAGRSLRRITLPLEATSEIAGVPVVPGYLRDTAFAPGTSGTANIAGAFIAIQQDACLPDHSFAAVSSSPTPSTGDGSPLPEVTFYPTETITFTPLPENSLSQNGGLYVQYRAESRYTTSNSRGTGILANTAVSPGQNTTKVFTLAAPQTHRTVMVEAERVGAFPELPNPTDFTDANGVENKVLHSTIQPGTAVPGPEGNQIYRVAMTVTYATLKSAASLAEQSSSAVFLGAGYIPWLTPQSLQTQGIRFNGTAPVDPA